MSIKRGISLLQQAYKKWSEHNATRLGASVAFYTLLSFAPLLILMAAMIALVFDRETTHRTMIDQARQMIGPGGAQTVQSLLQGAQKPASGVFASVVAFITLLFGASGVFGELHDALNTIWDSQPEKQSGWFSVVKAKLFSFGMVLSVGFLLLVSLIISAALAFMGKFFGQVIPIPPPVLQGVNFLLSFAVVTALFALMFRYVPARRIPWRDVGVGAIGTALLFTVGKFLLGLYLGKASVGSAYGAAGSLVAVVVWVYYSAQIFFFGAEFTRVYADAHKTEAPEQADQQPASAPAAAAPSPVSEVTAVNAGLPQAPLVSGAVSSRPVPKPLVIRDWRSAQARPSFLVAAALGFVIARAWDRFRTRA